MTAVKWWIQSNPQGDACSHHKCSTKLCTSSGIATEFGKGKLYYRSSLQKSSTGKYGLLVLPPQELCGSRLQQLISTKWQPKLAQKCRRNKWPKGDTDWSEKQNQLWSWYWLLRGITSAKTEQLPWMAYISASENCTPLSYVETM